MDSFVIRYLLLASSVLTLSTVSAQGRGCSACNCQFGNMDVLDAYTEAIVDARLAAARKNETGKFMLKNKPFMVLLAG